MFRKVLLALVTGLSAFVAAPDFAAAVQPFYPTWREQVGFIEASRFVSAPAGFLDFCQRHPEDCVPPDTASAPVELTADKMSDLNAVNGLVNDTLFFNSDLSNNDRWDYPQDNIGDCEDFVIEKRKRLINLGWPEDALLITLVKRRVPDFAGRTSHAVLTARTAQGDYILDNEIGPAVPWTVAGKIFEYIMIQTQENPRLWALVDTPDVDSQRLAR